MFNTRVLKRKQVIIAVCFVVLIAGGVALYFACRRTDNRTRAKPTIANREEVQAAMSGMDYGPRLEWVAEYRPAGRSGDYLEITVEEKLIELGARMQDGKLCDPMGREIRF